MESKIDTPKGFGQILDLTFSISRKKFSEFILIMLIFLGPIFVLQAVLELASGVGFFREVQAEGAWYDRTLDSFDEISTMRDVAIGFSALLSLIFGPIAGAAIILAVNHMRKGEEYTVGSVIKSAFSRFWPIFGSNILFYMIAGGLYFIPLISIIFLGVLGAAIFPVAGIIVAVFLFLVTLFGLGLFLTRLSFYFGSVVLKEETPGISRSWKLTKGRLWPTFGIYVVFTLIFTCITMALEFSFGLMLGNSVLLAMIVNVGTLFTSLIFAVGYAVMYFDLKARHDADDLKEMIGDYQTT
ncbi:hypothetical protein MHB50_01420 [Siminovitchia sp. FSL H7-0308]|uniref:hypothetical protein n=1 Tax=unclassified Siminovitchia TaxID=2837530 RepID=UPI0030D2A0A0